MFSTRLRIGSVVALVGVIVSLDASGQVRSFDNPQHNGFAVGYCGIDSASCGEYTATAWCVANGYEYATDWAAGRGTGSATQTVRLDDGAICAGSTCESFSRITCGPESRRFTTPVLGPAGRLTVLSEDRRSVAQAVDNSQLRVLVPGCSQQEPGVFACRSIDEFQHCRTLMIGRMIHSCRVDLAFEDVLAETRAVGAEAYSLQIESDAVVRVRPGSRSGGQVKGDARLEVQFALPESSEGALCRERKPYVYRHTGPDGGIGQVGKAEECDAPIEVKIKAHEDDALRAYDLCDAFAAWGSVIEDSIDVLVAGLFRLGADGRPSTEDIIAPYRLIHAPLTIECGI